MKIYAVFDTNILVSASRQFVFILTKYSLMRMM